LWKRGRVLEDFQLSYITKGKGVFQSKQSGLVRIGAGDAFLLFPGEWHRYRPDPKVEWAEYWINFNGEHAKRFVSSLFLSSRETVIQVGRNEALLQLLIALTEGMHSDPFFNPAVAAAQGLQAIAHLVPAINSEGDGGTA